MLAMWLGDGQEAGDLACTSGGRSDKVTHPFITNQARVLAYIANSPRDTTRTIAAQLGITERTVLVSIAYLELRGWLTRSRVGRGNRYTLTTSGKAVLASTLVALV